MNEQSTIELIPKKQHDELQTETSRYLATANAFEITGEQDLEKARDFMRAGKKGLETIKEKIDPRVTDAHTTWKNLVALRDEMKKPYNDGIEIVKGKVTAFIEEQDRIAQEEAEKAAERERKEAEKRLARIKKRIDTLAEKSGSLEEKKAGLEKLLDEPETTEEEAHHIRNQLQVIESQLEGLAEESESKAEAAAATGVPAASAVATATPKTKGLAHKIVKVPTVVKPMAVIKAVADGRVPEGVIKFDMAAIKKLISTGMTIPGVSVTEERKVAVR